jgi:hypothetical protein
VVLFLDYLLFVFNFQKKLITVHGTLCSRTFLIYLFLRFAGVSYGQFIAVHFGFNLQRIFRTVGDRSGVWERDLKGKTVGSR